MSCCNRTNFINNNTESNQIEPFLGAIDAPLLGSTAGAVHQRYNRCCAAAVESTTAAALQQRYSRSNATTAVESNRSRN